MKYVLMTVMLACLMLSQSRTLLAQTPTTTQPTRHTDAEIAAVQELFSTMEMDKALSESLQNTVDLQIKQNPMIAPYRKIMLAFFDKYMSWSSLKDDMATIYLDEFTLDEIKALTAFYKTPVGHKAAQRLPQLTGKGAELGMRRIQEHLPELREMIAAEQKRLSTQPAPGTAK